MEKTEVIKVENLSKSFLIAEDKKNSIRSLFTSRFNQGKSKTFYALKDINFSINSGEFVGIIGRNGSGKSTLLKIIAGIYTPDKGSKIEINGKIVPFLELGVGFNQELSGMENIYLNGTILGMSHDYIDSKLDEIIDFADLREFIYTQVKNYSSGMKVRLAFSIAIQSDADIYILDEVLAVGDTAFQNKSLGAINKLKKEGKTILYVSHSLGSIQQYCDRAILINQTKLIIDGTPNDVIDEYEHVITDQIKKGKKKERKKSKYDSKQRWGSYEVVMDSIKITNGNGKDQTVFDQSEEIKFQIEYTAKKDFDDVIFGVSIFKDNGVYVSGTNDALQKHNKRIKKGNKSSLTLSLKAKYLLSGNFDITVGVINNENGEKLDFHNKMYSITIINKTVDQGLVSLPFKWDR